MKTCSHNLAIRIGCILVCMWMVPQFNYAQQVTDSHTTLALTLCQEKRFDEALLQSDSSIADPSESQLPYTWYVRGFVYKEAYKSLDQYKDRYRKTAVDALLLCRTMQQGENAYNTDAMLKFLATSSYNEALVLTGSNASEADQKISELLGLFESVMSAIDKQFSAAQYAREIHFARGQKYYMMAQENTCDPSYFNHCLHSYQKALNHAPADCDVLYNLAVANYNRGLQLDARVAGAADCIQTVDGKSYYHDALKWLDSAVTCKEKSEIWQAYVNVYKALLMPVESAQAAERLMALKKQSPTE